jgi:uncharacterized DUF497 family protein
MAWSKPSLSAKGWAGSCRKGHTDVFAARESLRLVWDSDKASANAAKHVVTFDQAIEVFFDSLHELVDADVDGESRKAAIGLDFQRHLLFVVHIAFEGETIRIISARVATRRESRIYQNA